MARELRKVRVGRVVSDKMDKTVVVAIEWHQRHPVYKKHMRRLTKLYAHDKENQYRRGDLVRIEETRPISRQKRWRVVELLERRERAEEVSSEVEVRALEETQVEEEEVSGEEEREEEEVEE